ncbi:hypothetical protein A3Q56_08435 [Intoshia linei]|uniref:Integrase zinc-binding domain-containing protein n=1 Tax=Intoshia linei TaxID=1819745 RepID=A0A177APA0_9BILA|nr:hypothetical protein A3Q56_08435 [Intoshia linei]
MNMVHKGFGVVHVGVTKMVDLVRRQFFWYGLTSDIIEYVNKCEICMRSKDGRR